MDTQNDGLENVSQLLLNKTILGIYVKFLGRNPDESFPSL